jgi:PucR family transcriptional regulator, purine catabolism regulatory protein
VTVTIRALLAEADLGLSVRGDHGALDQEVRWVAVSELPDPTPWLQGAELLLTSGMWLTEEQDRAARADAWARRLARAGASGVGFGVRPWFSEVPPEILEATARHRLTLLAVPPETPFVAVDRRVADLHAEEARRREAAVVRSQQRLVGAARNGSAAVVRTLAQELPGWVLILDTTHRVADRAGDLDEVDLARLHSYAEQAAAEGSRSLLTGAPERPVYLVPLGDAGNRQGTLCVDGRPITANAAQRAGLVGTAAAILSVLSPLAATSVDDVVVHLLMAQDVEAARRVCQVAGTSLPGSLVAVCVGGQRRQDVAARALALGMWRVPSTARKDTVLLGSPALVEARLPGLVVQTGTRAGISAAHGPAHIGRAVQEAMSALGLAKPGRPVVHYRHSATSGLTDVLTSAATREFARALLSPLDGHTEKEALITSAVAWVQAQGRWDPAAAALGVHRATLRGRLKRLSSVLGLDLDAPHDRLALSLALEAGTSGEQAEH